MRLRTCLGAVGLAMLTAACASPDGDRIGRDGHVRFDRGDFRERDGEDGPHRPRAQLFLSPSGQPFRAPPGEPYPVAAWFAQADSNHDGRLSRDEFRADADAWFKVLDADGDGRISMPETTRWEEVLVPEIARGAEGLGGGFGGGSRRGRDAPRRNTVDTRMQGAAAYSLINEPHPIRGADADFSMSVDRAEWRAAADRRFALLDPDGDGAILLADLRPTPAQERTGKGRDGEDRGRPDGKGGGPRRGPG